MTAETDLIVFAVNLLPGLITHVERMLGLHTGRHLHLCPFSTANGGQDVFYMVNDPCPVIDSLHAALNPYVEA